MTDDSQSRLSTFQRILRKVVKRFIYSQLYLREALFILLGWSRPFVKFKVEATPPSLYLNFALTPEWAERLERELDLPHPLAKVRCIQGEEPFYALTLNAYRVSGLANGIRAEWSVYVEEPDTGTTRYLIVEACADSGSMDPMVVISRACPITHEVTEKGIETAITAADGGRFTSLCRTPDEGPPVTIAPEWIEANDRIYWRNGICDRTFYDAGLANPRARLLDLDQIEIRDETRWGRMVDPVPRHAILFEDAIEFAMSPWWNMDEIG